MKENCNQCHFCIRKDVLKQTCIYRKCVYLRSKPKPYARPQQSPQRAAGLMSASAERMSPARSTSPNMRTPSASGTINAGLPYQDQASVTPAAEPRSENPFFPQNLPQQTISPMGPGPSEFEPLGRPLSGRGQPMAPDHTAVNMNMHMNANMLSSTPPVHKTPEVAMSPMVQSPHVQSPPVQSPHVQSPPVIQSPPNAAIAGMSSIPPISNSVFPPPMPMSHMASASNSFMPNNMMPNNVMSHHMPGLPAISNTALPVPPMPAIPSLPSIPNIDRTIPEFRHPDQMPPPPHHRHPPMFPPVHPHPPSHQMSHLDSQMLDPHSRVPHMGFTPPNHFDSMSRGTNDSSCMYRPGLPYSMPSPFHQPTGSFFSSGPDMFRSQFLPSPFPSGYSPYPSNRYRDSFGPSPFTGLPVPPSSHLPQYPGASPRFGSSLGMGQSFPQQYSPYNSHNGCPKNGSCPPVSPSIDDVKVLQEGYKKIERTNSNMSVNSSASNFWEPWRLPSWFSPRHDEVRSRMSTSTLSSDFECDVISIDDHQMNAMIRSDGCNSIEIEFDQRSSGDESSPRKLSSRCSSLSEFCSPVHNRKIGFRPIGGRPFPSRSLFSDALHSPNDTYSEDEQYSANLVQRAFNIFEKPKPVRKNVSEAFNKETETPKENTDHDQIDKQGKTGDTNSKTSQISDKESNEESKKLFFKGPVCVTQDLGDEGIFQVTLPGHRVSIANITLDDELAKSSSNLEELLEFISEKPKNTTQTAQLQSQETVLAC